MESVKGHGAVDLWIDCYLLSTKKHDHGVSRQTGNAGTKG